MESKTNQNNNKSNVFVLPAIFLLTNVLLILIFPNYYKNGKNHFGFFSLILALEYILFVICTSVFAIQMFFIKNYARIGLIVFMFIGLFSDLFRTFLYHSRKSDFVITVVTTLVYLLFIYLLSRHKFKAKFIKNT
jgi:hypothetical protein